MGTYSANSDAVTGSVATVASANAKTSLTIGSYATFSNQSFTVSSGSAFIYVPEYISAALQYQLTDNGWECDTFGCTSNS